MKSCYTLSRKRCIIPLSFCCLATIVVGKSPSSRFEIPGRPYENKDLDDENEKDGWMGAGREFNVFDTRGGEDAESPSTDAPYTSRAPSSSYQTDTTSTKQQRRPSFSTSGGASSRSNAARRSYRSQSKPDMFQTVQEWWSSTIGENVKSWPKLQIRCDPTTRIKMRKTFHPLKTIVRLGAEFNTQLGVWQFKSSWEDAIIGGKLTLKGRELQLSKSWQLSVGAMEDLVTRLRFRAAVDLGTMKAYARVGFRTERLSPINVAEGFTIVKRLPLAGKDGNYKLEVKANVALPEPEIEYSTESNRSMVGMGDIEVNIEELNLLLDY